MGFWGTVAAEVIGGIVTAVLLAVVATYYATSLQVRRHSEQVAELEIRRAGAGPSSAPRTTGSTRSQIKPAKSSVTRKRVSAGASCPASPAAST